MPPWVVVTPPTTTGPLPLPWRVAIGPPTPSFAGSQVRSGVARLAIYPSVLGVLPQPLSPAYWVGKPSYTMNGRARPLPTRQTLDRKRGIVKKNPIPKLSSPHSSPVSGALGAGLVGHDPTNYPQIRSPSGDPMMFGLSDSPLTGSP